MDTKNGPGIEVPVAARPLHISRPKSLARSPQVGSSSSGRVPQRASRTAIPAQWITSPNPRLDWRYSTSPEARARMRQYNKEYFRTQIWEPALRRDLLGSYKLATEHWRDENEARRNSYVMAETERDDKDRKMMIQKKVRIISEKTDRRRSGGSATVRREARRSGDSRAVRESSRAAPESRPASRQQEVARLPTKDRTARTETNAHIKTALERLENRSPSKPRVSLIRTPPVPSAQHTSAVPVAKASILKSPLASGKINTTEGQKPNEKRFEAAEKESQVKIISDVIDIRKQAPPEERVILLKYSSTPMIDAENMAFAEFGTKSRQPHYILRSKMVLEMTKGTVKIPEFVKSQTEASDELESHGAGCYAFESLIKAILQKKVAQRAVPPVPRDPVKVDDEVEPIGIAR